MRLPFALMCVVAQLSGLLGMSGPPDAAYWTSTGLLVALFSVSVLGRHRRPWFVLNAGVYIASLSLLMISVGGSSSGLGVLLLMPVVGVSLFGAWSNSAVIVTAVISAVIAVSLADGSAFDSMVRRTIIFAFLSTVIAVSIHSLRGRLRAESRRKGILLHQAEMINAAATRLTSSFDPTVLTSTVVELAARVASPPDAVTCRGSYLRIESDVVRADVQDESGAVVRLEWRLADHPALARVVETRQPETAPLVADQLGPGLRELVARLAVTHEAWIPVIVEGELAGVLGIAGPAPFNDDCFAQLVALGHLLELALANSRAQQRLERQAAAEERRRIARELHDGLAQELAYIASKTATSRGVLHDREIREISGAADRALDEARRAITVLSAAEPDPLSLCIAKTSEDLANRFTMSVNFDLDERATVPADTQENLLRIVREAVTNAGRHAHASHLTLRLWQDATTVRVAVSDDGTGFDPNDLPSRGFGLVSMRERAEMMGANFALLSRRGAGTEVQVAIPKQ